MIKETLFIDVNIHGKFQGTPLLKELIMIDKSCQVIAYNINIQNQLYFCVHY